jgi:diguanylate cyclase (GGDEF)-like protein/PAS domain S-box-containing protein
MFDFSVYVLPFVISTIILFLLAIYSYRSRDRVETAGLFALQNFAMGIWTLSYALELSSTTLEGKIFWAKMKYLGATTGPVLWLVFSLYYTNHKHWLTMPLKLFLACFILFTLAVVFTNELHHWYWTTITIEQGLPETQSTHGFYFWIYAAGMYLLILASVVIYSIYYRTVPVYFRRQSILLVVGTFLPLGIRFLEDFVHFDPFLKVDNVILFLLLSAILYAIAIFGFNVLEIVPIAHNLVVRNINSGIIVLDMLGRVVEINPFAKRLIGRKGEYAIGKKLDEVLMDWPDIGYSSGIVKQHEQEIFLSRDTGFLYVLVQISPIHTERGKIIGHVIVVVDITDRKKAEMELQRIARTDVLTGVTNRRHFFELAEAQFANAQRYNRPLAILLLDVDHFKQINDRYGHLAGDSVLQMVAKECQERLRSGDIFARYGGEEFICLLPEQDQEGALETAERIRLVIEKTEGFVEQQSICVTVSVGVALIQDQLALTLEGLINEADQALYEAKANGRNQVSLWQDSSPRIQK